MCLSQWDGFLNNYFTYHVATRSGKWEMYPWDQDKTWSFHDGIFVWQSARICLKESRSQ
jgi:CotH kinase protein